MQRFNLNLHLRFTPIMFHFYTQGGGGGGAVRFVLSMNILKIT